MASIRAYAPHIIVAVIIASVLAASYGAAISPASAANKSAITWATNPLSFTFSSTAVSGSMADSFSCSPTTGPVQLIAKSSNPSRLMLTTDPTGFSSCGSVNNVLIKATCLTTTAADCKGTYQGSVQVRQPADYTNGNFPEVLKVIITVT